MKELADYEKMLNEVVATEELLKEWIFEKNKAEVIFDLEDGMEIGFDGNELVQRILFTYG